MASETSEAAKVEDESERSAPSPEQARRELEEQFNVQRARMKELFLQKEEDLQRLILEKQQLESEVLSLRAELQQQQILSKNQHSELQNLQLLVSETVEASSSGSEEARRLRARTLELEQQLAHLKHQLQIAHQQQQNVEDEELNQCIIEPLHMEITALKNKLRETDARLQEALKEKAQGNTANPSAGDSKPIEAPAPRQCDMCLNYEKQLVSEQAAAEAARDRASKLDQALKMATDELEGVRSIHDETIRSWHTERASSSQLLEELRGAVEEARGRVQGGAAQAERAARAALDQVTTLTVHRETLQRKLDTLERDNAVLVGQYTKKAEEMQNEVINLPDNVEELQEVTLQLREQLIECSIGREQALRTEQELRSQLIQQANEYHLLDTQLQHATREHTHCKQQLEAMQAERAQMQELGDKLRHSNDMIDKLLDDKKRLHGEVSELRGRVCALQQELDNSEKVQQDFVRLSQSLQVQLQRIREADTEVRWQHDDDVSECPSCRAPLNNTKKKVHCRHCGRIFCGSCVSHTVASGPRGLPARVCAVCRTLLQPHTAPYFSQQPPRDPD